VLSFRILLPVTNAVIAPFLVVNLPLIAVKIYNRRVQRLVAVPVASNRKPQLPAPLSPRLTWTLVVNCNSQPAGSIARPKEVENV
jgi:hypothetical protein